MRKISKLSLIRSVIAFIFVTLLCCSGCAEKISNISPKEKTGITSTPGSYDDYEGKYYHAPYTITVSKVGDTLYVQTNREKKYELYCKSGDLFSYKTIRARIKFNRDRDGKVKSLNLFQYGDKMVAKKLNT